MCSSEPFINPETPLLGDLTDLRYCLGIAIHQFEQLLCNCNGGAYRLRFERVRYIRGVCTLLCAATRLHHPFVGVAVISTN